MGIFDIDSGADNHLLNEQFHVFSKSPASVATALGDASNRSGHTVTASDVWSQEIPAFFYAKTQAVADTYKSLAKTNDLCRIGNSVAIFENGDWVVKYNSYTDIPDGHKFKNAAGDRVIRFHKNRLAYNLNLDNNAADDGLNTTAKIQGWDDENSKVYDYVATAPKFVTQFVTSTDKIVDGIPSKGFGPFVMAGTTTGDITKVLPEGASDANHYIANSFAGIIQFNKARTDAIYVHAFEYCGKTLKSTYSDIVELEDKLSKISMTAAGGLQGISETATKAGLSTKWVKIVDDKEVEAKEGDEGAYPVVDITTAEFKDGIFVDNDDNKTKLVTAQDVTAFVNNHVKENSVKTISINDNSGQLAESFVADENNNISLGEGIDKVYNINRLFPNVRKTHYEQSTLHDESYDTVENGEKVWDDSCALTYLRYYFYMQDVAKFGYGPDEIYAAQDTASSKTDKNGNPLTIKDTISYQKMQGGLTVKYFRKVYGKSIELQGNWATRFFRGTKTREITYEDTDDEGNVISTRSTYINPIDWTWRPYRNTDTNEIKHDCILTGTDIECNEETGECTIVGIGQQAQPGWIDYSFDAFCNPNKGWDLIINGAELDEYNSEVSASGIKVVQAENLLDSITVTPATYTSKDGWNDVENVVTGSTVKTFVEHAVGEAKATLTASTDVKQTGIIIDPNGTPSKNFTIGIDQSIIATVASVTAITNIITDNKEEIDGKISTINGILEGLTSGDNSISKQIEAVTNRLSPDGDIGQALASTASAAASAIQTVKLNGTALSATNNAVDITAIVGVDDRDYQNGIQLSKIDNKVALSVTPATYDVNTDTWSEAAYFTTAGDVSSAISALSDRVVTITDLKPAEENTVKGVGFDTHSTGYKYLSISAATYTPSSESGEIGTWTDTTKNYLVTGATVAAAISDVNAKVEALHQTPQFSVVVVDDVTDPAKWQDSVTGGIKENVIYLVEDVDAADGSYIEYIAYKNGEIIVTERIGTTKTDLSGYVKTVTINGQSYTATANNAGTINIGKAASSIASGQATTLANQGSVYANIATDGTLTLGVASATDSVMGVSKMFTGNLSTATATSTVTDTAVSVKSAQAMYSSLATLVNSKVASVTAGSGDALTGLSVNVDNTDTTAPTISVTNGVINSGSIPATATVVANGLIDGTDVIETEKINFGLNDGYSDSQYFKDFIPENSQLTTWVGDMPNLQQGTYLFSACSSLTSFCGDLSSMVNGQQMFEDCSNLTSFTSDLSSLTNGGYMFMNCKLDAESLECIADTLPRVTGSHMINIGYNCSAAYAQSAYDVIIGKGWSCDMTYNG